MINDKTFAAGQYTIERTPGMADSPSLLLLREVKGGNSIVFDSTKTATREAAKTSELIFDNIDGTYFLAEIWVKGSTSSNDIPMTRRQRVMMARRPVQHVVISSDTGF
ncbi:MAG: hypothetical protein JO314_07870 [Acidobacteria bacterium]|nr:hypothetical protein [Acidobacteriota bacterium]